MELLEKYRITQAFRDKTQRWKHAISSSLISKARSAVFVDDSKQTQAETPFNVKHCSNMEVASLLGQVSMGRATIARPNLRDIFDEFGSQHKLSSAKLDLKFYEFPVKVEHHAGVHGGVHHSSQRQAI